MLLYKLTDANGFTRNKMKWELASAAKINTYIDLQALAEKALLVK